MNINNLYPTDAEVPVGSTAGQFIDKLTARIDTLSPLTQESYWLGYISYDNLPLIMQHSKLYYADEDTVVIENDTVVDNYPCGYIDQVVRGGIYMVDDVYVSDAFYYQYIRFLNDLHPEYSAAYLNANTAAINAPSIYFLCYLIVDGEIVAKDILSNMYGFSINFNNNENDGLVGMMEFMQGLRTITVTVGQLTYDITIEYDLYETGHAEIVSNEDPDTVLSLFINTMNLPDRGYINGTNSGNYLTAFAAKVKYEDDGATHSYNVVLHQIENYLKPLILYVKYQYGPVTKFSYTDGGSSHNILFSTGAAGEFSATELDALDAATGFLYRGNFIAYSAYGSGGSNKRTYLCMVMPGKDLYKIFSLYMYRVDVSSNATRVQATYINNVTYATDVNSSNEFLARLKTGNISDDTFRDGLRYWQYSSITNNDFEEDDVPPYEPEPEPDDDEEIGSTINRPTTLGVGGTLGFVTQYSLTATQVGNLGRILWTSFLDPDYYKNFLFSLALDTGSFNMSSLLQYFISLRVYPFPLINVPSHAAAGNNMFVGAGTVPLAFSDTLHTINNYADYINAGAVTVPRHYHDFRDYVDAEYMLYLPYCGTVQLNPGDVVGNVLTCQYAIDFASGACIAYVDMRTGDGKGYPIAALPGHIGADVPLTATNAGEVAARLMGDAMNIAQIVGGVPAGMIGGGVSGFMAAERGDIGGAAAGLTQKITAPISGAAQYAQQLGNMYTRPAIGIPMLSGGRGFGSFGAPQTAYLQIRRGLYKQPDNYEHTMGTPSTDGKKIEDVSGLITAYVDTQSLTATADEAAEIAALIRSGIIV